MTMLLQQHGIMGNPSGALIPTDKTKTFSALSTFDENRYYLSNLLHQNPKDKRIIVHTFTDGVAHVYDPDKKLSFKVSTDRGQTFGTKATLYDPSDSTYQVQDPGVGMDHKGRLHMIVGCYSSLGTNGGTNIIRYMYSDDNGSTVSSPASISLPSTTLASFRFYGRIIDTGSVLIAPCFFFKDETDVTQSERWILRSTDYGDNWTWVLVEGPTTEYINESECLSVTQNIIFMVSRYEDVKLTYIMYKSVDAGLTWVRIDILATGISSTSAAPCRLHKFRADNGKWYAAMYFPDRGAATKVYYVIYGRLDNGVDGGLGLFNVNTRTSLTTASDIIHYGDFCHYNGNMNAIGAFSRELGTPLVDNQIRYFEAPATQYNTIAAFIDPITIYDKLGNISFIAAWRGLVSNTTNDYGVVNGSSQVTTWKSLLPGPTAQDFTATSGGIVLDGTGLTFDGTKALTHGTSTSWNFMSYASTGESNINYTTYFKLKIGTSSNPGAFYGIMGNSGNSAGNRGVAISYNDNTLNDALRLIISKGSAGFIIDFVNASVITPNVFHVVCIEVDLSQGTTNNKAKLWVDGVLISTTVTTYNTGVTTPPTYNMQIGAVGNNVIPFIGTIKDVIIQNTIDLPTVRTSFTQALIDAS